MSDLNAEIALWLSKAMAHNQVFAPKPMPVDLYDNNEAVRAARLLEGKAEALSAIHEGRAFDGREPFTDEDYAAFSAAHKDLAEGHRILGEELKANRPDALQAISAHGDAMALHNDAARLAEMRLPSQELGERNLMWPHMESNQFRFGRKGPWDTEEKNWRKAHQAFIASQLAAQKTAFDTGVVEKGDVPGHPFHGNQYSQGGGFSDDQRRTIMGASPRDARESADVLSGQGFVTGEQAQMMSAVHNQLSNGHNERAQNFFVDENPEARVFQSPKEAYVGEAHFKADEAHRNASQLWGNVAEFGSTPENLKEAVLASHYAEGASSLADEMENKLRSDFGKSFSAILKGDLPGHEFRGNQYTTAAVGILRDLAEKATAANDKARPATDVLGVSGPRTDRRGDFNRSVQPYSTPRYLQSQTDNAKEHNDGIARTATALADRIEADPSKTLSEHLGEFRESIARLRSDGQFHTGVDNYDTGAAAYRAANVAQAVHDQLQTAQMVDMDKPRVVKSTEIVQKGDVPGHVFHGNQYVDGTSSIPDDVGHRDFDPATTIGQIGKMNVLAVSGGKVNAIHNIEGAAVGVELPVSSGYKVRVFLRDDDTYTVQRVNKDTVKGEETGVFADQVGESVYQAGMYKSNPFGGHTPR